MSIPGYVTTGGRAPAFVSVHEPRGDVPRTGVVICPPFGWEEVCSYRARRTWAQQLAAEGRLAVRLQLPGTGDAGGSPRDADLLETWVAAVADVVAWTRSRPSVERVTVVGLGLGGILGLARGRGRRAGRRPRALGHARARAASGA